MQLKILEMKENTDNLVKKNLELEDNNKSL